MLSAILYLGNVTYKKRASGRDEGLDVGPPEVLDTLSQLLKVPRGRAGAIKEARTGWGALAGALSINGQGREGSRTNPAGSHPGEAGDPGGGADQEKNRDGQ